MTKVHFDVDARLLRELGARLVGRPHIALAELIKNAYDADATKVEIAMRPDSIVIADNGHGMTESEFRGRWMRIGTAQKEAEGTSRGFDRPLTGSKGVGRLAVQLLANHLSLQSTTGKRTDPALTATVDWQRAVQADLLTKATAQLTLGAVDFELPGGSKHGTRIVLTDLQQVWTSRTLQDLAREIWPLQPPFATNSRSERKSAFTVTLDTGDEAQDAEFAKQMSALLQLWTARLVGELLPADAPRPKNVVAVRRPPTNPAGPSTDETSPQPDDGEVQDAALEFSAPAPTDAPGEPRIVRLSLSFHDGTREVVHYELGDCAIDRLKFEIRVFTLKYRQPAGITVGEARAYLRRFGGVHVYDAGFHLPYYGPDTDWLHVEIDHSHRLSRSALLPAALAAGTSVADPLQYLPTNSRLFGVVEVDTNHEGRHAKRTSAAAAREALSIQVTRDRLTDNHAARSMVVLTRFALDFYAIREAQRAWELKAGRFRQREPIPDALDDFGNPAVPEEYQASAEERAQHLDELLEEAAGALPEQTLDTLRSEIQQVAETARNEREATEASVGLLGALATAGIAALANEHESARQNLALQRLARRLRTGRLNAAEQRAAARDVDAWLETSQATRRMFGHLLDQRTRDSEGAFAARSLIDGVVEQLRPVSRGVVVDTADVPTDLRLADGGYAEWTALLQNVILNAVNATLDAPVRRIQADGGSERDRRWLRIQDTGSGVDLASADRLFAPFERRQEISRERAELGLGGTGLGLTIVRMLATNLGVSVGFEPPEPDYSTAFVARWRTR